MPVQSSEQQELNKIRELRRALANKRRLAEESRVKALAAPTRSMMVSSAQPLTAPEGFHFATDDRLKTHGMETRQDSGQYKETCFSADLRHYAPVVRNLFVWLLCAIDVLCDFNRDRFCDVFYAFHVLKLFPGFQNKQPCCKVVIQQFLKETEAS